MRAFFAERGVLEVETPLLGRASGTDPHLAPITCSLPGGEMRYLQTSPELAMKRLLAAGSGPIYQIGKAFREGEAGRHHNPEFTMLEWYRPGLGPDELMDEIDALLAAVVGWTPARRLTYRDLFEEGLGVDPHRAATSHLRGEAEALYGRVQGLDPGDRDGWLDLLFAELSRRAGDPGPLFVHDFPASQAALARIRPGDPPVAVRFELVARGLEIANGYHELTDPAEQRRRFADDLAERRSRGLPDVRADESFLAALEAGLPDCSGVALGIDRLLLAEAGGDGLPTVLAFPWDRA